MAVTAPLLTAQQAPRLRSDHQAYHSLLPQSRVRHQELSDPALGSVQYLSSLGRTHGSLSGASASHRVHLGNRLAFLDAVDLGFRPGGRYTCWSGQSILQSSRDLSRDGNMVVPQSMKRRTSMSHRILRGSAFALTCNGTHNIDIRSRETFGIDKRRCHITPVLHADQPNIILSFAIHLTAVRVFR